MRDSDWPKMGVLVDLAELRYCVFEINLFSINERWMEVQTALRCAVENRDEDSPIKIHRYTSTREMVEAGWVGD